MNTPNGVELERQPCPLGCAPGDDWVLTGWDRLNEVAGEFRVVRCRSCGLARTNPRPTPETMGVYYPDDYGPYLGTRVVASPQKNRQPTWRDKVRRLFDSNGERLPPVHPPGRMLEIGCASGGFMYRMARSGWEVEGIEPSPSAARAAQGLGFTVHVGSVEQAPDPRKPYDLVVGWMVLEHLHDPIAALRKLRRWTQPGGWLAVSVPNTASAEFRLFRDRWYALQVPTHLFHFTPRTLARVLEEGGWRMERVLHQHNLSNLIASFGYLLQDRGFSTLARPMLAFPEQAVRVRQFLHPLASLLALVGQTGRMTVWARRLDD